MDVTYGTYTYIHVHTYWLVLGDGKQPENPGGKKSHADMGKTWETPH